MAATRKLQAEIDRCLKKVAEGVEKFEETWQKVHNASNANQKEKYEEDLKKEIKKLQRLRDQIKTWIASGEIKDKSVLMDKRKLIEQQMERFKIVERETKTKAYSKEGLTSGTKLDPAERERADICSWLNSCLESLNIQIDQFEAEIECLQTSKKKKNKNENAEKIDEFTTLLEKHRDHVQKLETILRMVDNKTVEIDQVRNIKDDVEYYIENCQEPDFTENDMIYDDIDGLEEMLLDIGVHEHKENSLENASETMSTNSASSPVPFAAQHNHSNDLETDKRRHKSSSEENKSGSQASSTKSSGASSSGPKQSSSATATPAPQPLETSTENLVTSNGSNNANSAVNNHVSAWSQVAVSSQSVSVLPSHPSQTTSKNLPSSTPVVPPVVKSSAVVTTTAPSNNHVNANGTISPPSNVLQQNFAAVVNGHATSLSDMGSRGTSTPAPPGGLIPPPTSVPFSPANSLTSSSQPAAPESMPTLKSIAQKVTDQAGLKVPQDIVADTAPTISHQGLFPSSQAKDRSQKTEAHIPPLLGVAPLGPVPLTKETQSQYQMLEAAFVHMPHPSDSERLRPYLPRNPCTTPPYYPQLPPQGSDSIEFFQRLSTETLFFIFYYMEGTKAQYLAAKALKKQSWRFHTKYMMWFQRHEEPKVINDEYEQGTYIYFDFEKWGQRKKEGFTFEYRFLEDRELN